MVSWPWISSVVSWRVPQSTIQRIGIHNSLWRKRRVIIISTGKAERVVHRLVVNTPEGPFINGVSAPLAATRGTTGATTKMQRAKEPVEATVEPTIATAREYMQFADEVMEGIPAIEEVTTQIVDRSRRR
jgi:hypothetical protein